MAHINNVGDNTTFAQLEHEISITIDFSLPEPCNTSTVARWLGLLESSDAWQRYEQTDPANRDQPREWLEVGLDLTTCLLRVLRFPVFETFHVASLERSDDRPTTWTAVCNLSAVQPLPQTIVEGVLSVGFKLGAWACKADPSSASDRDSFYATIENDVVKPFAAIIPQGKSTIEVLRVAHESGVPYFSLPGGVYQLGMGSLGRRIHRSTTDQDSALGVRWCHSKVFTAQLLRQIGLPAPSHVRVKSLDQARQAASRIGFPVVIKPADLERGEGVSVDVQLSNLELAFAQAHKCSPSNSVLVEQQVPGVCHRLFMVAGELLYAVRRLPIGVYADGKSAIENLVAAECEVQQRRPPWKRSGIRPLDDLALEMLALQGLSPTDIPGAGQFVALRRIESSSWGGVDEDVSNTVHKDNVSAAVLAARCFGLEVAGVDLISTDISQPWHANGAIINEVNYAPLLGGGDISRSRIPKFLEVLLKGNGRIPVHVHVGSVNASRAARVTWQHLVDAGVRVALVTADQVLLPSGEPRKMPSEGVYSSALSLVLSPDTEALVIVVQTDEFLQSGFPFGHVTEVYETDEALVSFPEGLRLDAAQEDNLRRLIRRWRNQSRLGSYRLASQASPERKQ